MGLVGGVSCSIPALTSAVADATGDLVAEFALIVLPRAPWASNGDCERGGSFVRLSVVSGAPFVPSDVLSRIPITGGTFLTHVVGVTPSLGGRMEGSTWAGEPRDVRVLNWCAVG